jgi:ferredoxin--NADP+ reductase
MLSFALGFAGKELRTMARELNAIVGDITPITPDALILRVIPDGWELGEYQAGQFVVLGLPMSAPRIPLSDPEEEEAEDPEQMVIRAYSIASSSKEREYLEFYISLVRSGTLTPRIFALQRGDRVHLGTRFSGMFTLQDIPAESNLVMIATGTGLAPYMSMIRTTIHPQASRKIAIIHGASHSWDLGYRSELTTLDRMLENFHYLPIITRPDDETIPWGGETGYIQDLWKQGAVEKAWGFTPTPENSHVFLCGNPGMVTETTKLLEGEGFKEHSKKFPGEIHLEKYW